MTKVNNYINGAFTPSQSTNFIEVLDPATNEAIAQVPNSTSEEIEQAVASAKEAQKIWGSTSIMVRVRVMFEYQALLKKNIDALALTLSSENGKTLVDAKGDVQRGYEVVEHCCAITSNMMGETMENVATNIDTYNYMQPIGVCAGITPFNFPAMVPLWMFPLAIACGNSFVLKPSEQTPLTAMKLTELFAQAGDSVGAPKGILQIVHGGKSTVDAILYHEDIHAISFVGSVGVGRYIYETGCKQGKRVQSLMGAKNHMTIMPDANKEAVLSNLVGASLGAAGQRCMAISVAVFVGDSINWVDELKERFLQTKAGHYQDEKADFGPVINKSSKAKIDKLIGQGIEEGADCLVDGRDCKVEGFPNGNWVGPTLFNNVTTSMSIYQEEIFGPVLCCMQVASLEEAIELINANQLGNGTSIFTSSGKAATTYRKQIQAGQVGINIPIPVALPFFSFTGWKGSFSGDLHTYGKEGIKFYTQAKTITERWFDEDVEASSNMTISLK